MTDEWLKLLAPGTLLYSRIRPEQGFLLVYHAEVQSYVGPWTQLKLWFVDPTCCRLMWIEMEASLFHDRWAIVDVNQ